MKKDDVSQISLRVDDSLIAQLKLRAKAEGMSVNSLVIAMIETGLSSQNDSDEFYKLIANPEKGLSSIHRKICDPWGTGTNIPLNESEVKFIAEGALKGLEKTPLAGPFYEELKVVARHAYKGIELPHLQQLFSFALRYYLEDMNKRTIFAAINAPDGFQTASYDIDIADKKFTFVVSGNEMNRFTSQEEHTAPAMFLLFKNRYVEARLYWDTISALARILEAVHSGNPFENRSGSQAILSKNRSQPDSWLLFLERKIQLIISDSELHELAEKFVKMWTVSGARIMHHMRLLYGEG